MAENNTTYYQSRHTGAEIDNLLDQSIAATEAANASAKKADDAAENANQEAAKIPGMVAVLAASDCSLAERVEALEKTLIAVLSGAVVIPKLQVRELGVWGDNNLILTGAGAPTKAPDRAGRFYIDTASGAVYKSTGNAAVADWEII